MSLPYLVPMAVKELTIDPLIEGDLFKGDLLQNVLRVDDEYFEWDKRSAFSVLGISERAAKTLKAKELAYGDNKLLALAEAFIEKYCLKFRNHPKK